MVTLLLALVAYLPAFFVSRHNLALEAVALRQQLAVFKRKQARPEVRPLDSSVSSFTTVCFAQIVRDVHSGPNGPSN
jgi:hypothetical protein